jgi:hypothetical protein
VDPSEALAAWRWLVRQPCVNGVVILDPTADFLAGCGIGVFVSSEWLDLEIASPKPGLNSRVIASIVNNEPRIVLEYDQIATANANGCLDVLILYSNWRTDLLSREQVSTVHMHLAMGFLDVYCGYRLQRIVDEATNESYIAHLNTVPAWTLSSFDDWFASNPESSYNRDRALGVVTYDSCMSAPGTVAMTLFQHRKPTLGLRSADQSLLLAALDHVSDKAIAEELHISTSAVRWRWAQLFTHLGPIRPELVDPHSGPTRGREKRNRVLAYVREHPEELRPWKA